MFICYLADEYSKSIWKLWKNILSISAEKIGQSDMQVGCRFKMNEKSK